MITLLKALEPFSIPSKELLYQELDDVNVIHFVEDGMYDLGFEINKVRKFKLRLSSSTLIGAFNICFNKRMNYLLRTHSTIKGQFIRKSSWKKVMAEFPEFEILIKRKVLFEFIINIKQPLEKLKKQEIQHFRNRMDYQSILALVDFDKNELGTLIN